MITDDYACEKSPEPLARMPLAETTAAALDQTEMGAHGVCDPELEKELRRTLVGLLLVPGRFPFPRRHPRSQRAYHHPPSAHSDLA